MFFAKRRWALRVVCQGTLHLPAGDRLTTELVGMIVDGAKQFATSMRTRGLSLSTPETVLLSAAMMADHPTALARLERKLMYRPQEAMRVLRQVAVSALAIATEAGFPYTGMAIAEMEKRWAPIQ